jgi:hypothetical protein
VYYATWWQNQQTDIHRLEHLELDILGGISIDLRDLPYISFDDVAESIDSGDLFVEYLRLQVPRSNIERLFEDRYFRFVIGPVGVAPTLTDIGPAAIVDSLVRAFRSTVTGRDEGVLTRPADVQPGVSNCEASSAKGANPGTELFRLLFCDMSLLGASTSKVYIVPDGELFQLAFETLPTHGDGRLIDAATIVYRDSDGLSGFE